MILTAHQPVYLPWLGLFAKIAMADTFVLFDEVRYTPRSFENRNKIWTSHGPSWLTVPVKHSRETLLKEVEINNDLPWQRKHWRSLEQSYHKAAYWQAMVWLGVYYGGGYTHLADLTLDMLKTFLLHLEIKTTVLRASDFQFHGTKSELVLDMCQQLGAHTYIFGALGRDYADVAAFEKAGIQVIFQDYHHPIYSQFGGPFQSHLSVIDLLLHHGPRAKEVLLDG